MSLRIASFGFTIEIDVLCVRCPNGFYNSILKTGLKLACTIVNFNTDFKIF